MPLPSNIEYEYVLYDELYRAYLDCRKRKRHTSNAAAFEINLTENLYRLWIELNTREYKIGSSIVFVVDRPVKREVFAADFRDRIIHHLIINRIMSFYEKEAIENSFSCRVGKGTLRAAETLRDQVKELSDDYKDDVYVLKCDLKSFFMSINKRMLYEKISELIRNKVHRDNPTQAEYLCWLVEMVIMDEPQTKCKFKQPRSKWAGLPPEKSLFTVQKGFGIPIGNLNSQIFANYFLDVFDKYVIYMLGFKYYGRYVDDFYILSKDKQKLIDVVPLLRDKLAEIGVTLHPKKIYLQHISKGVKFVGSVIKPNRTYISNRTVGNLWTTVRRFYEFITQNEPTLDDIAHFIGCMNSYLGHMKHHNTYNIRIKLFNSYMMKPWYKYCYIHKSLLKLVPYAEYNIYNKGISKIDLFKYPERYKIETEKLPLLVI